MNITADLATKVLHLTVYCVTIHDNTITYRFDAIGEVRETTINLHEFTYRCKLYTNSLGYNLISSTSILGSDRPVCYPQHHSGNDHFWQYGNTEPEAIIAATNWVINNT